MVIMKLVVVVCQFFKGAKIMATKKTGGTEYVLTMWSFLVNIPCAIFIGFAWWKFGWIADIVALDSLYISRAIIAFTLYAVVTCTWHVWKTSRELNVAQAYVRALQSKNTKQQAQIESGSSLVAGYIDDIKGLDADGRRGMDEIFAENAGIAMTGVSYNIGRLVAFGFIGTLVGIAIALKVFDIPLTDQSQMLGLFSKLPVGLRIAVYPALLGSIGAFWLDLLFQILDDGTQRLTSWVKKAGVYYAQQSRT